MTEQPEDKITETEGLVPDPESETTTAPGGDQLADAVSDASGDAPATEAGETPADDAPAADAPAEEASSDDDETEAQAEAILAAEETSEAPKPRRRRRGSGSAGGDAPAQPAPTRRRAQRDPSQPAPVVRAQAKYVRSSARKARLVCDHIRGKSVVEARAILAVTPRAIAEDWSKLLESAVANAEHNHELVGEDLYVKAVHADEGPTIKRFRPRAMGRASRIRKRTSHLTILLTPKD
jgi:ribosomal protein L22